MGDRGPQPPGLSRLHQLTVGGRTQKKNGVRGEAPSTRFLKITHLVIFSRFSVWPAVQRYNCLWDCLRHAPRGLFSTPTTILAGVFSTSVATGTTAAMPAFSTSTRATLRRTRTRTSARDYLFFSLLAQAFPHRSVKILPHRTGFSRLRLERPRRQTRTEGKSYAKKSRLSLRQDG